MKNISVFLSVILLSSCSFIGPKFDNIEYMMLVDVDLTIQDIESKCNSGQGIVREIEYLIRETRRFDKYTSNLSDSNKDVKTVAVILNKDAHQMLSFYKKKGHNEKYCVRKTKLMRQKAEVLLPVIASERR